MCSKMGGGGGGEKVKERKKRKGLTFFPNLRYIHLSETANGCWPCDRNQSLPTNLQERNRGREKMTQMRPTKRTDWINGWWEGRKANLFTRSLKYKLQEARTFWWTSNSLPSTIIFRSVNSFSLRCWFNSFNISVEQRRNRQCQTRV